MRLFGRIVAVLCMVLAALVIVLNVAGIVGLWRFNNPIIEIVTETLALGEGLLQESSAVLSDTDQLLNDTRKNVQDVQQNLEDMQADVAQSTPIVDALALLVEEDLQPQIAEAWQALLSIQETLNSVQQLTLVVGDVIDMPTITAGVGGLSDRVNMLVEAGGDLEGEVSALQEGSLKAEVDAQLIQPVLATTTALNQTLVQAQTELTALRSELRDVEQAITALIAHIPGYLDLAWIFVTLILLWMILAQAALFYLALVWFRTGSLRWRSERPLGSQP